jgi:hypothetical protein
MVMTLLIETQVGKGPHLKGTSKVFSGALLSLPHIKTPLFNHGGAPP